MKRSLAMQAVLTVLVLAAASHGFIDPKFTPANLVKESQTILVGTLSSGDKGSPWKLAVSEAIKGKAPGSPITFAEAADDASKAGPGPLADNEDQPVIVFVSQDGKSANLHVSGQWLKLTPSDAGPWRMEFARQMSGVWAGGTDMLIRLARYLQADPKATVPVSVGMSWMRDTASLGKVAGTIAGMQAVELGGNHRPCVFVASDKGDRLYRARENDEAFEDITAEASLDTHSKQFTWMDLDAGGELQLVSWNGSAIQVRRFKDGKSQPAGKDYPFAAPCLGLAPCVAKVGVPAVLVTTADVPVLVYRDKEGAWQKTVLPAGDPINGAGEVTCACIVADFDNDGYVEILQPRSKAGLRWKGKADGFGPPQAFAFACLEGPGRFCMGDFDADGTLDIFLSGPKRNELWQNDGNGGLRPVLSSGGSLSYKCPPGVSCCCATDLNHDGRTDLCILYAKAELSYHFNRGFRCFGEEGDVRLSNPEGTAVGTGQVACAIWDFNGDGALDMAVAVADGRVACYYNDAFNKPMLRVSPGKGLIGPVTFSVWQGAKGATCLGTFTATGGVVPVPLREPADCVIKYSLPGKPGLSKKVSWPQKAPTTGLDVVLD